MKQASDTASRLLLVFGAMFLGVFFEHIGDNTFWWYFMVGAVLCGIGTALSAAARDAP